MRMGTEGYLCLRQGSGKGQDIAKKTPKPIPEDQPVARTGTRHCPYRRAHWHAIRGEDRHKALSLI